MTSNQNLPLNQRTLALIPAGIALNLVLGTIAFVIKAPLYLDAIGTIAITLLAGLRAGIFVGVASFLIGGLLVNPVLPWFAGTQACIAIFTHLVARLGLLRPGRWKFFCPRLLLVGGSLGVVTGVVSAPVIAYLFGGVTGSGASLIVAFLLKSGETLFNAVLMSGIASEPIDKTIQLIVALSLIRSMPESLRSGFGGKHLIKNGLANE